MNILNIILLSCSVAVTVAQKVDTSNDIIDGQRRNAGGYGLLRPGLQGGYNPGGYNPGGYNQGGFNQGGYNQGGYNQGYPTQGGYNQGYGGYNQGYGGYNQGYGGAGPGGYWQGYGGNQGIGQGYGGNPGLSRPGFGSYPTQGGYPGGYPAGYPGSTGGYGGGIGGYPSGYGQGYPGYGGSGNRPGRYPNRPDIDYSLPVYPETNYPGTRVSGNNKYRPFVERPLVTPYNVHTGKYYAGYEDRYRYSDKVRQYLGRNAGEIKMGEQKS
ncbi:hypothetical protein PYW08_002864 [Mythimna loreyi]|uniref:Uncharacterized protein n=1 Tax=Mythimna loreyi TaxID=667449 RepID=A0ACC2QK97_9NEOP|nr:hypothetical protein PYW08_002864 [Mythimna loreyi]